MTAKTSILAVNCPYNDKECPKLEEIKTDVKTNEQRLNNMERLLYIIIGMIAINSGLILWR